MTLVAPSGTLDAWSVATTCQADPKTPLTIDLRSCRFIQPAGLVFLGVMMEAATTAGKEVILRFDPEAELAKYIERMGLRRIAEECGVACDEFPTIRHHASADRFVELTRFAATGDSVIDDVTRALQARAGSLGADAARLHNAVFELGVNVEHHADSTGLVAVQNYPQKRTVEFAVGDFGIGIRPSLADGGLPFETDGAAIRAAVETFASRFSSNEGRGKGLPALREHLCGDRLRGYLIVQSGEQRMVWRHGHEPNLVKLNYKMRGTLAFGMLRTG